MTRPVPASFPVILPALMAVMCSAIALAEGPAATPDPVLMEEYPVYDRVVQAKFLTSETTLVTINRLTVTQLGPGEEGDDRRFLRENQLFDGGLQPALLMDFLLKLIRPSRLQQEFNFGVRYRLVSDHEGGGDEVSLAPVPVGFQPIEYDGTTIALEFSRVAFSPRQDQALVYAGNHRVDGSGAGFLVLLNRREGGWEIQDTEVIWTAQVQPRS